MATRAKTSWKRRCFTLLAVLFFLAPACYGFGKKFQELLLLALGPRLPGEEDGSFAVMPLVNYLLASAGFLLLLIWASLRGMFHDIERPKYTMLETERELDEAETVEKFDIPR